MELVQIIMAIFTGAIALALFVYVSFTIREKGFILSNDYLFATPQERKHMDLKTEYHLVSVVYSLLGIAFLLLTIYIITSIIWLFYLLLADCTFLVIYAIVKSIQSEIKNNKNY